MQGSDFKDNPINWSWHACTISGIRVRVHLLFILWMAFQVLSNLGTVAGVLSAVVVSGILFGTVLLHELGHCFGARHVGGDAEDILMWPLGGLAMVSAPMKPTPQLITTVAGPAVNLAFCLLTGPILLLMGTPVQWNPFNLLLPYGSPLSDWGLAGWISAIWVINFLLLLFNLLPTFPMDGGRILQAGLWYGRGYRRATLTATFVGMIGAVIYGLIGLVTEAYLLLGIAFFGYLTCMRERMMLKQGMILDESEFGGFSGFESEYDAPQRQSWLAKRRARKAAERAERDRVRAEELEQEIDDILEKVHRHGMHSLTPREKRVLEQGTAKRQQ